MTPAMQIFHHRLTQSVEYAYQGMRRRHTKVFGGLLRCRVPTALDASFASNLLRIQA